MKLIASTFLSFAILATLAAGSAAPAAAQVVEGEEHCVVNVSTSDVLNVRKKPSASAAIVTTHAYGDCGIVVTGSCKGSWCPIEDGHMAGWVNSRFISMVSPALYCVTRVAKGDVLNMRAFPSTKSKIIAHLSRHQCDIAFLPYTTGSWQKVRADGHEGWVNRNYLSGE